MYGCLKYFYLCKNQKRDSLYEQIADYLELHPAP